MKTADKTASSDLLKMRKSLWERLSTFYLWEHTGSNRGPSACKADALNQLSYAPNILMNYNRYSYLVIAPANPPDG